MAPLSRRRVRRALARTARHGTAPKHDGQPIMKPPARTTIPCAAPHRDREASSVKGICGGERGAVTCPAGPGSPAPTGLRALTLRSGGPYTANRCSADPPSIPPGRCTRVRPLGRGVRVGGPPLRHGGASDRESRGAIRRAGAPAWRRRGRWRRGADRAAACRWQTDCPGADRRARRQGLLRGARPIRRPPGHGLRHGRTADPGRRGRDRVRPHRRTAGVPLRPGLHRLRRLLVAEPTRRRSARSWTSP